MTTTTKGNDEGKNRKKRCESDRLPLPYYPPEDHGGNKLTVGTRVTIPAVVTECGLDGFLNLTLETDYPFRPGMETTTIYLSSYQVVTADAASAVAPPAATPASPTTQVAAFVVAPAEALLPDGAIVARDLELARSVLYGVFYRRRRVTELPLLIAMDRGDAEVWIAQQAQHHGLDPQDVEIVAVQLAVPLILREK